MEFVSKYNLTFVKYMNRKYNKKFQSFDDYGLWLYELVDCKNSKYYDKLEDDLREYCNYQQERKNNYGKSKN